MVNILRLPTQKESRAMLTFGEFLRAEQQKRGMNLSEFARFLGLAHNTVAKYLEYSEQTAGYPDIGALVKIAKALNVDLGSLVAMIEPSQSRISPSVLLLAEQISRLPAETQDLIKAVIIGLGVMKGGNE